ncbi:MAG: peroxiredoxin-like family protein [Chloroflexota bacterium]
MLTVHLGSQRSSRQLATGDSVAPLDLVTVLGRKVRVPTPGQLTHLQFRRFAGCPVCDLHLHSFVRREADLAAANVNEVVFFHSSADGLRPYTADLPFAVVPDPDKVQYRAFGVEAGPRALLDPRAWSTILRSLARSIWQTVRHGRRLPPTSPEGGRLGLPADFLLDGDGRILACKYGEHAADQWTVDNLIALARRAQEHSSVGLPPNGIAPVPAP